MLGYFGLVDDFAARHHDGGIEKLADFTKNLIFAVVFDEKLLINDGHIIASPVVREAVLKPKRSPLRQLVETGYVKILTRNQRQLGTLAQHMADGGIKTAQELLGHPQYPALRGALDDWCATLGLAEPAVSFRDWPACDTSEVYESLALAAVDQAISNVHDQNHKRQLTKFGTIFRERERRNRTTWEVEVNRLREADELSDKISKTLQHIANEAYQYSWGCALSTGDAPVKVHTRTPEFLDVDQSLTPRDVPKRQGVTVYGPDLELAAKKVGHDWTRLAEIAQEGHEIFKEKRRFQTTLEDYYRSSEISDEQMKECADKYSKALMMHFGGEKFAFKFDLALTAASTAAGLAVAGPAGAGIGLGIGLVGNAASHLGGPKFIRRLTLPLKKKWIRPQSSETSTSCFQVDPKKAAEVLEGVSPFAK
jgi:hypothetical protein